jgi:muconolactone delta-isomerase
VLVEMLVYPKDEKDADVVEVRKEMEGKSPCQRLRGTLFVLWKALGEKEAFELFYSQEMEKIITWIKRKIDEQK